MWWLAAVAVTTVVVITAAATNETVDYSDAQVLRVANVSQRDVEELAAMEETGDLEMISVSADGIDVLLNDSVEYVKEVLDEMNMTYSVIVDDIQEAITQERLTIAAVSKNNGCHSGSCFDWNNYYRLSNIYSYLNYLQQTYKQIRVDTIGVTSEKRPIYLVKILTATGNRSRRAVWVEGGAHAREWVGPAAAVYIAHQLLASLGARETTFSGLDYYILPVMNPDGYEYTHTTDRFWRKNRSANNGSECVGTDLNRNWDFHWGGRASTGAPCSHNYRGHHPFSEIETKAASKYMLNKTLGIKGFISLHSYGQKILFPWGYTYSRPSDYRDLYEMAYYMSYKVRNVGNAVYQYGAAAEMVYVASGGSQDWAKGKADIKYSYTMELRDTGKHSFSLPVTEILPTAKDAFAAFTVLAQKIKNAK